MSDALRFLSFSALAGGRRTFLLALGVCLAGVPATAGPPPFRLIVHPANPNSSVSRDFLAEAFLKKVTRWDDGEALRPVDQRADSEVRRIFSESVLRRSVQAVKIYWQQRIFSGRGVPPAELESDAAVVEYVLKHRGAVGYVSGTCELGGAKVLAASG